MERKYKDFSYRAFVVTIMACILVTIYKEDIVNGYFLEWSFLFICWNSCLWLLVLINNSVKTIYPISVKKTPKYFKKLCMYLYDSEKAPVSLIRVSYLMVAVYVFYTILMFGLSIVGEKNDNHLIVYSYFAIGVLLLVMAYCAVYMDMFKARFKRINKYNIRYYFYMNCNLTRKWPTSTCIGTCRVLETYTHKRKLFVVVEMNDTGEVYNDVLVDSEYKEKKSYKLYDICNVKYIVC